MLRYCLHASAAFFLCASNAYSGEGNIEPHNAYSVKNNAVFNSFPSVTGQGYLIVVGNNGYRIRVDYGDGEQPTLSDLKKNGETLMDGIYRYEFRSTPQSTLIDDESLGASSYTRARTNQHQAESQRLHGTFTVYDGILSLEN